MATPTSGCGYGDPGYIQGGYGDHDKGYGSPCSVLSAGVVGSRTFHDLGGEVCTIVVQGAGLPDEVVVTVGGLEAYSNVYGQRNVVVPVGGNTITFVLPSLYGQLGPADVNISGVGLNKTFPGMLVIVRYPHRTNTILIKTRYPRLQGPYWIPMASHRK